MIVNIRGGLGTQVIELLGQYAIAHDRRQSITGIDINCGGESWDGAQNVLADYISGIFPELPVPVRVTNGHDKLGALKYVRTLELVLKRRELILKTLGPVRASPAPRLPVLHVRRGDYQWVPLETYVDYARAHDVCLIGNIPQDTAAVPGENISTTPVNDWLAALNAPSIIGTASTFILSILFINPEKRIAMLPGQEGAVFSDIMEPLLRRLAPYFPNLEWL